MFHPERDVFELLSFSCVDWHHFQLSTTPKKSPTKIWPKVHNSEIPEIRPKKRSAARCICTKKRYAGKCLNLPAYRVRRTFGAERPFQDKIHRSAGNKPATRETLEKKSGPACHAVTENATVCLHLILMFKKSVTRRIILFFRDF